jgi:hypothetical protein
MRAPARAFLAFPADAGIVADERDFNAVDEVSLFGSLHALSMNELHGICTSRSAYRSTPASTLYAALTRA